MSYRSRRRRGAVAVIVALCLVTLLGIVAVSLDGGLLLDQRRRVQAAADAAALAAAIDLYNNAATNRGLDPGGTAKASALAIAAANGYTNDGTRSIVTVNIPAASGKYANRSGYAEVIVQFNQQRGFGQIFGSGDIPVVARAVTRGISVPVHKTIIVLDPTSSGAFNMAGNGSLTLLAMSGEIAVNSTSATGCTLSGGASITASQMDFGGTPGYSLSGSSKFSPGIVLASGQPPTFDPFRYVPLPNASALPLQSSSTLTISGSTPVRLNPGLYVGGISITGKANVTLNAGVYYLQGGVGFSYTGQGSLVGSGVMLYNDTHGGTVRIAGQGPVTLSPPFSGPYLGLAIFQDRSSTAPVSVTGTGNMNITGTLYAANATLNIQGNGAFNNIGSQYVGYDVNLTGSGTIAVSYMSNPVPTSRLLGLVE